MVGYLVFIVLKNVFKKFTKKILIESKARQNRFILLSSILVPYIVIILGGFYDRYRL